MAYAQVVQVRHQFGSLAQGKAGIELHAIRRARWVAGMPAPPRKPNLPLAESGSTGARRGLDSMAQKDE